MNNQRPLPPLEEILSPGPRAGLRRAGLQRHEEGSDSVTIPLGQHPQQANADELADLADGCPPPKEAPTEEFRALIACAQCARRKIKCSRTQPCTHCQERGEECRARFSTRKLKPKQNSQRPPAISVGTQTEEWPMQRPDTVQHSRQRWHQHDRGSVWDVTGGADARPGLPSTYTGDIIPREQRTETGSNNHNILPSEAAENASWDNGGGDAFNVVPSTGSDMGTGSWIREPLPDSLYSLPSARELELQATLPESFWNWAWPGSGYVTGSQIDGVSIPAQQRQVRSIDGVADGFQYPNRSGDMQFQGDPALGLYNAPALPCGPLFGWSEPVTAAVQTGFASGPGGAPTSFPRILHGRGVHGAGAWLPTGPQMLACYGGPLPTMFGEFPTPDAHHRNMHEQLLAPVPVRNASMVIPRWLQSMEDYSNSEASPHRSPSPDTHELFCDPDVLSEDYRSF